MKKSIKVIVSFFAMLIANYILPTNVFAHCPLCVAGAGAGLTLSRLLGVDDSITGIWIGAFLGAISFWTERPVFKMLKIDSSKLRLLIRPVIYGLVVVLTLLSFYQFNLVNRMSQIAGLDKLTFGILFGSLLFYFIDLIDDQIILRNKKVYFPYQRIIVSLGSILLASLFQYYLINYVI